MKVVPLLTWLLSFRFPCAPCRLFYAAAIVTLAVAGRSGYTIVKMIRERYPSFREAWAVSADDNLWYKLTAQSLFDFCAWLAVAITVYLFLSRNRRDRGADSRTA